MTRNKCPACGPPATAAASGARIIPVRTQYIACRTGCLRHPVADFPMERCAIVDRLGIKAGAIAQQQMTGRIQGKRLHRKEDSWFRSR
jgi:hypothetical protein